MQLNAIEIKTVNNFMLDL